MLFQTARVVVVPAAMTHDEAAFFKALGSRIAVAHKGTDQTQVQLAETLGVSQQIIASYEVGRRRVPLSLLPRLARALSVTRGADRPGSATPCAWPPGATIARAASVRTHPGPAARTTALPRRPNRNRSPTRRTAERQLRWLRRDGKEAPGKV
jgi:DNA-binding XRE family transcriptional regulator